MKKIELKEIIDLAYLASCSPFSSAIQHYKTENGKDIYFLLSGTVSEPYVYYTQYEDVGKRFINLNTTNNKINFSDIPIFDPKNKVIPIIEVKNQDLFKI